MNCPYPKFFDSGVIRKAKDFLSQKQEAAFPLLELYSDLKSGKGTKLGGCPEVDDLCHRLHNMADDIISSKYVGKNLDEISVLKDQLELILRGKGTKAETTLPIFADQEFIQKATRSLPIRLLDVSMARINAYSTYISNVARGENEVDNRLYTFDIPYRIMDALHVQFSVSDQRQCVDHFWRSNLSNDQLIKALSYRLSVPDLKIRNDIILGRKYGFRWNAWRLHGLLKDAANERFEENHAPRGCITLIADLIDPDKTDAVNGPWFGTTFPGIDIAYVDIDADLSEHIVANASSISSYISSQLLQPSPVSTF